MHVAFKVGMVGMSMASVAALLFACGQAPDKTASAESAVTTDGALVRMDLASTVGVLLDEIPAGPQREAAAANALAEPASFWEARARNQVRLMSYRLVFRGQYYSAYWSNGNGTKPKGPLPLPPKQIWNVKASGSPHRMKIDTHDVVVNDYTFQSYIVTDSASPGIVEPALATVGGTWAEAFNLPVDPELLLQRTGYSCMDEDEFPPGSVFEENTWYFYDDACTASDTSTCHVTQKVSGSCNAGLVAGPGHMAATLNFTRVAYDATTASAYRVGTVNSVAVAAGSAPDLSVVNAGLVEEHDLAYRFFAPGSCELGEGVIGQLGWRRLLMFSAIVQNDGSGPLEVGSPTDPNNPFVQGNVFEFSQCHGHYHFSHYGTFGYAGLPGSKRAFCLEDTNRYHNDETTALSASHQTCENQGIERGWGDEYNFGIPGQWVDVTTATTAKGSALTFSSNPDQFLCEGTYALDSQGHYILDATSFINPANGQPESRTRCNFLSNWSATNFGSTNVAAPNVGSFVTDACNRGQTGPNRDCGFTAQSTLRSCTSGSTVTLSCTAKSAPEVLRVCERSGQLGIGVACTVRDSVANAVVGTSPTPVSFACPAIRDAQMVNGVPQTQSGVGGYSLYQATMGTLSSGDNSPGAITCTGF
jgi:hypothetical protein